MEKEVTIAENTPAAGTSCLSSNATLFWRVFVPVFGTVFWTGILLGTWLTDGEDLYMPFVPMLTMRVVFCCSGPDGSTMCTAPSGRSNASTPTRRTCTLPITGQPCGTAGKMWNVSNKNARWVAGYLICGSRRPDGSDKNSFFCQPPILTSG